MFGFRPPVSQPSSTESSNVQQPVPSIFQQSPMPKNTTSLTSSATVTPTPAFGLFQVPTANEPTGKPPAFQFSVPGKSLLPAPSQSDVDTKPRTNIFKSPQFGSLFEKSGNTDVSQESTAKNPFAFPGSQHPLQSNPPAQTIPTFSFANPTSAFTTGLNTSKPTIFNFNNPEKGRVDRSNISTQAFSSRMSAPNIFGSETTKNLSEGKKPVFSFVKAKDVSDQPKQIIQEEKVAAQKPLKMDVEAEESPKKKLGIKSRISLPVKPLNLEAGTIEPTKSKPLKSPTAEEISKITSIVCRDIPDKYNNKKFIIGHFSKFGTVKSTRWNNKKKQVTVTFLDHASAKAAKTEGCSLGPGEPKMQIFLAAISPRKKSEHGIPPEVQSELQAMGGSNFFEPKLLSRPDVSGKEPVKKSTAKKKTDGPTTDESLRASLDRIAMNYGDRYEILDARDKLMRMKMQRQSDIYKAIAVAGTCPDMCPEKERYSRTEKNGLSLFELHQSDTTSLSSSNMNPKAVIKEYSRSSADQEEPLSHDLRPAGVLNMTMDYILCNIMDVNCSAGEWFDFIWNRTRAIRKDITQQHLCDQVCVSLVEKCARFHIHCAAAFCHEDISVFDPKINNENLTKCLQTLKHFYHDLSEKGIFCPNEAEYMAYDILLNLNEGDTIRQAQQFRSDVRESDSVRFATEVFFAQNSNNYVRFFRLVQKTSYLNACILQRYFPQVRRKAFAAMCRAYRNEQFPLQDLIHLLCFEDNEEIEQYCEWLQLQIEAGTGVLLRKLVFPSTAAPAITKSSSLINKKRLTSVGEVVNGGPLLENPYLTYEPHDSFDSNGKLRKSAYDAQDQAGKKVTVDSDVASTSEIAVAGFSHSSHLETNLKQFTSALPVVTSTVVASQEPLFRAAPVVSDKLLNEAVSEICTETLPPLLLQVVQDSLSEAKQQFSTSFANQTAATIVADVVNLMSREISESVVKEIQLAKRRIEEHEFKLKTCREIMDSISEEVLVKCIYNIAHEVIVEGKQERLERMAEYFQADVLNDFLLQTFYDLAGHIMQKELEWAKKIEQFTLQKRMERARKVFRRWHCICVNHRTFENVKKSFPSGPIISLETAKRIKLDVFSCLPIENQEAQMKKDSNFILADLYYNYLNCELSGLPLDVLKVVKNTFLENSPSNILDGFSLWKLLIFTPSSNKFDPFVNIFRSKFSFTSDEIYSRLQNNLWASEPNVSYWKCPTLSLGISTVHLTGIPVGPLKNDIVKGTSAVLLPIIFHTNSANFHSHLRNIKCGLHHLLRSKSSVPPVPLSILLFMDGPDILTPKQESELLSSYGLDINPLLSSRLISGLKIFYILNHYSAAELNLKVEAAVLWLAQNVPELPKLNSSYLDSYLEDSLKVLVLNPVFQDLAYKRKCFNSSLQSPAAILCLYNAAIQFLAEVVSCRQLQDISWPAPEFASSNSSFLFTGWNHPGYLHKIKNTILNLELREPFIETSQPYTSEEAYEWIETIKGELNHRTRSAFVSVFERELSRFEANEISSIPWASILFSLFSLLLSDLRTSTGENNVLVRYKLSDIEKFKVPLTWLEATRDCQTEMLIDQSRASNQTPSPSKVAEALEEYPQQVTHSSLQLGPVYYQNPEECKVLEESRELNTSLQEEKLSSYAYTEWLRDVSGDKNSISPSKLLCSSSFEFQTLDSSRTRTEKRKSLSDSLEDSFFVVQQTLRNEKESTRAFQANLRLLEL